MAVDLYRVERALSGKLPLDDLTSDEAHIFQREKPAFEVGQLANRLAQGYYAHYTAAIVAQDPAAKDKLTSMRPGQPVPTETVARKNGTTHIFDSHFYLDYFNSPEIAHEVASVWLVGALLSLGDALANNHYFDRRPELEMVYHLRNGIAHGNRFHFKKRGLERLKEYPAHNRALMTRVPGADFEITPALAGEQVLFNFMGPGDVLDLLQSISFHLGYLRGRL